MTPKEKAVELVAKFKNYVNPYIGSGMLSNTHDDGAILFQSKQCALIAVDEILLSRKDDSQFDDTLWANGSYMYTMHPMYLNYWNEVKSELIKL
jgi:hypothetical protein